MTESSFPIVDAKLSDAAWAQTVGATSNGILDDWGGPYAITVNTNDTVTIKPSTTSGFARAVVNGFGHQIDANVTLSVPAVTSATTYHVGLLYDSTNAAQPVKLTVLKNPTFPLTPGQSYLPLYVFARSAGQTLQAATLFSPKPRLRPTLYMASDTDLLKLPARMFLYGTEVKLPGKSYMAKGSAASPSWELQHADPTTGSVSASAGFKVAADTSLTRQDDMVELYIHATGSFTHTNKKFATIQSGFRPAQAVIAPVLLTGGDFPETGGIAIGTDGGVQFYGGAGTHNTLGGFVKFEAA